MPYLGSILGSSDCLECVTCGTHTYAARCKLCERSELVPAILPTPRVSKFAAADSIGGLPWTLTARELEMLQLVAEGESGPDIAAKLYLSPDTVKGYLSSLYRKLGVHERAAAVAVGMRTGVIE